MDSSKPEKIQGKFAALHCSRAEGNIWTEER
jgi:hypothetical protein